MLTNKNNIFKKNDFDELDKILNYKEELKDSHIDLSRMSSAYILLLLSYLRVNMNRNTDKPLCCYRLYQKISEDIGLSERYISRIVEILDVMNKQSNHQDGGWDDQGADNC